MRRSCVASLNLIALMFAACGPSTSSRSSTELSISDYISVQRSFRSREEAAIRSGASADAVAVADQWVRFAQRRAKDGRVYDSTLYPLRYGYLADGHARLAYAYLLDNQPALARQNYLEAFQTIQDGYRYADAEQAASHARRQQMQRFTAWAGVAVGAIGQSLGGDPRELYAHSLQTLVEMSQPRVSLGERLAPDAIDEDVVRFPAWISYEPTPFASIGRVRVVLASGGASYCTGAPIGARLILTNAHCVADHRTGHMDYRSVEFLFERSKPPHDLESLEWYAEDIEAMVDRYPIDSVYTQYGRDGGYSGEFLDDWAILVTPAKHTFRTWFGWAGDPSAEIGQRGQFYLAGYSSDLNNGQHMTVDWGCTFIGKSESRSELHFNIEHNCGQYRGSSGAPVIKIEKGEDGHFRKMIYALHHSGRGTAVGYAVSPAAWSQTARELRAQTQ